MNVYCVSSTCISNVATKLKKGIFPHSGHILVGGGYDGILFYIATYSHAYILAQVPSPKPSDQTFRSEIVKFKIILGGKI